MRRSHWRVALAVGATVVLAACPAFAGGTEYPTAFTKFKYKLENGKATFKGQIDSPKGACAQGRKVELYRQKSGNTAKIGGDHTDAKGKFLIDLGSGPPKKGKYYAKIKQTKLSASSTCLGRTSGSVKLSD